jgi:phospholipid/cholesterol/gamma-HCH transport system permease protein
MIPALALYCTFVGLLGSFINVYQHELTSFTTYFESAFSSVGFLDLASGVVKSVVYGFTIGIVGNAFFVIDMVSDEIMHPILSFLIT